MPYPITKLPDAELALIQYLRTRSELTAYVPADRIMTTLPPKPVADVPYVLIKRIGGSQEWWGRIDHAAIQVDVIGGSRYNCQTAVRAVRATILAIAGDQVDEATLVSASEEVGPQWMPDMVPVPPVSRFVARFQVLLHP
jgi:hypothetical protein